MSTVEIRVRPVVRYIVTRYTQRPPLPDGHYDDGPAGKLETLGEFPNEQWAEQVAEALRAHTGNGLPSRFTFGDRVVCVGYEHVVKSIKFTPGKIEYGLVCASNNDGEVLEYKSEDVYPLAALGLK